MTGSKIEVKTADHILSYPLVAEPAGLVLQLSVAKWAHSQLAKASQMILSYLSSFSLVVQYWNYVDSLLNSVLVSFDKTFPLIANFSFVAVWHYVVQRATALYERVYAQLKALYKAAYDQLLPVVKVFDPVIKLANDYYEYVLNLVLPYTQELGKEAAIVQKKFDSEYHRALQLWVDTYKRIQKVASKVSDIPTHVSDVYNEEAKETKTTAEAVTKTTQKLTSEAYDTIKPTIEKIVGNTSAPVSKDKEGPVDATLTTLDALKAEATTAIATSTGVEVH